MKSQPTVLLAHMQSLLGESEIVKLLEQTLEEEKAADQKLTKVAKKVNAKAQAA